MLTHINGNERLHKNGQSMHMLACDTNKKPNKNQDSIIIAVNEENNIDGNDDDDDDDYDTVRALLS